jgi:hypothetical protein
MRPTQAVSTTCSYCGSSLVDADRAMTSLDRVAPFRIPRRAAEARLREHLVRAFWAPEVLRKGARRRTLHASELRGVLVPFHAYRAKVRGRYTARVGVHWHRTETVVEDGKRRTNVVRETQWFPLSGTFVDELEAHPVCASAVLTKREVRGLLPFDFARAHRFDARWMAGWDAELPTRPRDEVDGAAIGEIRELEARRLRKWLLPGDAHEIETLHTDVELEGVDVVLLPVWMATYRQGERVYRLLVNGQTGRCCGWPPVSRVKISLAAAALALVVVALLWMTGVLP